MITKATLTRLEGEGDVNDLNTDSLIAVVAGLLMHSTLYRTTNDTGYLTLQHTFQVTKNKLHDEIKEGVTVCVALLWATDSKYWSRQMFSN